MFKLSEKATELLKKKLSLNYKEEETLKKAFFEFDEDAFKVDESGKETTASDSNFFGMMKNVFSSNKEEKAILNDILSNFVTINKTFDNVVNLLMGNALTIATPEGEVPSEVIAQPGSKRKRKKEKSSFLSNIMKMAGLAAFAFSPAILDFLKEDPEKIKESLTKAFDWITTDLPNFFKNDLGPFIKNFLDSEIVGSITGMDILKSAGIAAVLYSGKGVILNILTSALLKTTGFFLKSFFGFLVSGPGLAVLAGTGIGALLYKGLSSAIDKGSKGSNEYQEKRINTENKRVNEFIKSLNDSGVLARGNIKPQTVRDALLTKNTETGEYIGLRIAPGQLDLLEKKTKQIGSKPPDSNDKSKQDMLNALIIDLNRVGIQSEAPVTAETGKPAELLGYDPRTGEAVYKKSREQMRSASSSLSTSSSNAVPESTTETSNVATDAKKDLSVQTQAQPESISSTTTNAIPIVDMTSQNGGNKTTGEAQALSFMSDEQQQISAAAEAVAVTPPTSIMAQTPSTTQQSSQIESSGFSMESFVNNYINAVKPIGSQIGEASAEVIAPRKPKPIVIPPPRQTQRNKTMVKPGESWNINDVPDPTPKLGNLLSQLFVPETNFSGAISI